MTVVRPKWPRARGQNFGLYVACDSSCACDSSSFVTDIWRVNLGLIIIIIIIIIAATFVVVLGPDRLASLSTSLIATQC